MRLRLVLAALVLAARASAQIPQSEYAARREALLATQPDGVILALGAPEPAVDYEGFWQAPSFEYLTGFREPGAALVLVKREGRITGLLFVEPKEPSREVWTGARLGVAGVSAGLGLEGRDVATLPTVLDSLLAGGARLGVVGDLGPATVRTPDQQFVEALKVRHPTVPVVPLELAVARLRGRKSAAEVALLRRAIAITVRAQGEAMRLVEPDLNEFEVQALVEYTFRRLGADRPGFGSIVGSGPNSTVLHYGRADRVMRSGELVVLDIGASYQGYTADVTRTLPVGGTFTPAQRALYQAVRDAQAAAERQVRPGGRAVAMSDSATASLAAALTRLGLIESPTATYDCGTGAQPRRCRQVGLYFYHGLGHGIGLEVHDPDQYQMTGVLAEGSVFTIEPGLYVRGNLLELLPRTERNAQLAAAIGDAVRRHADTGVRIEDDYLVTADGFEWLSRAPREVAEIEAAMRGAWKGPEPRDRAAVERYPRP